MDVILTFQERLECSVKYEVCYFFVGFFVKCFTEGVWIERGEKKALWLSGLWTE